MNTAISVMIPHYERVSLLKECLDSVVSQISDFEAFEICVVDDCSKDFKPIDELISNYSSCGVKIIRHNKNIGQINNLNFCINYASSHYVHILHCDDRLVKGFYDEVNHAINNYPESGAIFTRSAYIDMAGNKINISPEVYQNSGIFKDFFFRIATEQLIQTPAIVVKKAVYEDIGLFEDIAPVEDWEMWVRIAAKYDFYYINNVLAEYRLNVESVSTQSQDNGQTAEKLKLCIERNFKIHKSKKIRRESYSIYLKYLISILANRIYRGYSLSNIYRLVYSSFKFHPNFFHKIYFCFYFLYAFFKSTFRRIF